MLNLRVHAQLLTVRGWCNWTPHWSSCVRSRRNSNTTGELLPSSILRCPTCPCRHERLAWFPFIQGRPTPSTGQSALTVISRQISSP